MATMAVPAVAAPPADEFVCALFPGWSTQLFLLVTRLGNVGFVLGLLTIDYWIGDHERGAHALAVAVGGLALITATKTLFAAPRPPAAVTEIPISGYGFPSGHALAATVGYGVLAADLRIGSRRSRYGVAAGLVVLVALSRVALGVHFVRDVVGGVVVGLAFLGLAFFLTDDDPLRGFVLAACIGLAAVVISGASHDGVAAFGATLGALATWTALDEVPRVDGRARRAGLLVAGLPVLGLLGYVATVPPVPLAVVFVFNATLFAVVLAAPKLVAEA